MSSAATQTTPASPPPEQDRMMHLMAWVEIHWNRLIIGLVLVVVAVGAILLWRHYRAEQEVKANAALLDLRALPGDPASAPKASDYLRVAEGYASTSAAGRARLLAAGAFFEAGQFSEALTEFEAALAQERDGPLAAQAAYGVAASLDALDRTEDAAARYQAVIAGFPAESVASQARLALARLQESRQQPEAALRLYDEVLRDRDAGPFAQQAMQQRATLVRQHPQLVDTNPPPSAPAF